jgi:hypothetical protein
MGSRSQTIRKEATMTKLHIGVACLMFVFIFELAHESVAAPAMSYERAYKKCKKEQKGIGKGTKNNGKVLKPARIDACVREKLGL